MNTATTGSQERVFGIDLARGTAALLLASVHVVWMYADKSVQTDSIFGSVMHTVGQATGAFLIAMGFSLIVTRHQSLAYTLQRAAMVLLAGYLLNALKFIVPIEIFGTMPESFINAYGWQSPLDGSQLLYLFLTGDILQMAGISFAIAGLIRHTVKNRHVLLGITAVSLLLGWAVRGYRPGVPALDYLCDLLWGTQWNVYFPVLPWISNILAGMYVGMAYQETRQESTLYNTVLKLGVACLIVGGLLCAQDWKYHFHDFFHARPGGALFALGANLCFYYLFSVVLTRPLYHKPWFRRAMRYLSGRVTSIYLIQWVLICWGMGVLGYHTQPVSHLLALIPVATALTLLLDYGLLRLTRFVNTLLRPQATSLSPRRTVD